MVKNIFIAGYSGDIGNALYTKLKSLNNTSNIFGFSGRDDFTSIKKIFEDNIGMDSENILINCIGCGVYGMFTELGDEKYIESFEGNFLVPVKIIKFFSETCVNIAKENSVKVNTKILNINSKSSLEPFPQGSAYNSMKAALSMSLKILQKENKKYGLKVSELYPGVIHTKMLDSMPYIPLNGVTSLEDFIQEITEFLKTF